MKHRIKYTIEIEETVEVPHATLANIERQACIAVENACGKIHKEGTLANIKGRIQIVDMPNPSGWIAVSEQLPEIGEAVFLLDPTYGPMIGARGWAEDGWLWGTSGGAVWHNGQRWECDCHQDADYKPTHWHAMPALRKKPPRRGNARGL